MKQDTRINISIRALVELFRSGDIAAGRPGVRGADGIRCHQIIQRRNEAHCPPGATYLSEVPLSCSFERGGITLAIGGRADGVIINGAQTVIEEIKTVLCDPAAIEADKSNPLHWAQVKCYAAIYASRHGLGAVTVQLTYFQVGTHLTASTRQTFTDGELQIFFNDLVDRYLSRARTLMDWARLRDAAIGELSFPFAAYREGQMELVKAFARTIREGGKLFAQAPTGIGKTMAVLFPAVKALADGSLSKLFYLTAKTSTRGIAEDAIERLRQSGLRLKTVTLTAREKICFRPGAECDPETCENARGYYDRLHPALSDILILDAFTRPVIEDYARRHRLCPFEFSLDLSLVADCVICDYNYAFDPRVYLRRFFDEEERDDCGHYAFLIDEAHNLVDRAREMFSAELNKCQVLELRRLLAKTCGGRKKLPPEIKKLDGDLGRINTFMLGARKACEEAALEGRGAGVCIDKEAPDDICPLLRGLAGTAEELLRREEPYPFRDALLEFYFAARGFLRTADYFDERYVTYFEKRANDVRVRLFCLDPSRLLRAALERARTAVFFSATLSPLDYFAGVLGGEGDSAQLRLPSPFPRENLCLLVDDSISTKYRMREFTYGHVARSITAVVGARKGNYLVFFPSYQYLRAVYACFTADNPAVRTTVQREGMSERERLQFLEQFSDSSPETLAGFAVMGGVFGEGVDLVGERLSGAIIVGVGLPQIGLERDIIRTYFNEVNERGFEYAYVYPGMNKVLQAAGRLIRTETDRGVVLLIDERFSSSLYQGLYPPEWHPVLRVRGPKQTETAVRQFWGIAAPLSERI